MVKNLCYLSGCLDNVERRGEFTFGEQVIKSLEINFQSFSLHGIVLQTSN